MSLEHSRRRKLTQLVAYHILGDEYRDVPLAVVNAKRQTDHLRRDRRAARPGLDRRRLHRSIGDPAKHLLNAKIDKRSFF